MPRRGITLVDVIVLLVIAGLAAGLFLPALVAPRESGCGRTRCSRNMRQIYLACALYSQDFGEEFPRWGHDLPAKAGLADAVTADEAAHCFGLLWEYDYLTEGEVFQCPRGGVAGEMDAATLKGDPTNFTAAYTDCGYDMFHTTGHHQGVAILADQPNAPGDPGMGPNHGGAGVNVGYVGGNVRWEPSPDCSHGGDNIYDRGATPGSACEKKGDSRFHSYVVGEPRRP